MDRNEISVTPAEASIRRLRAAVDLLEGALDRRLRLDASRADAAEEFALMQDDRARLATELETALERVRKLETANSEAAKKVAQAGAAVEEILRSSGAVG